MKMRFSVTYIVIPQRVDIWLISHLMNCMSGQISINLHSTLSDYPLALTKCLRDSVEGKDVKMFDDRLR